MFEINKWDEQFETAHTRKRQRLGWYLAPSGTDSKGYRKLMRNGKEGILALGVFSALCQYTATLTKNLRGKLANSDGSPMDIEDISEITRMEVADIRHASGMLVACGWLTLMDKGICQDVPLPCHSSANFPQGEGTRNKEQEEGEGQKEAPARQEFPTLETILKFAKSQPLIIQPDCAETYFNDMEACEWVDKFNRPIKNWQASLRAYASRWNQYSQSSSNKSTPKHHKTEYVKSL